MFGCRLERQISGSCEWDYKGRDSPKFGVSVDRLTASNPRRVGLGSWGQERLQVDGCRESEVSREGSNTDMFVWSWKAQRRIMIIGFGG